MTGRMQEMSMLIDAINDLAGVEGSCDTDKFAAYFEEIRKDLYARLGSLYFDSVDDGTE